MVSNKEKGKILEDLVEKYLEKQGYNLINPDTQDPRVVEEKGERYVEGRGILHQMDALGQSEFNIPFTYQLRLLVEAKCWQEPIGPAVVREHIGRMKDISENYFVGREETLRDKSRRRFTDVGAIFSTSHFRPRARQLAYAQGVYLMPVPTLKSHVAAISEIMDNRDIPREEAVKEYIEHENLYIYFGLASQTYPLTITSDEPFPEQRFEEKDEEEVKIEIEYKGEEEEVIEYFTISLGDWKGRFQLPRYLWEHYIDDPDFARQLLETKQENLNRIDLPFRINSIRRILTLRLDRGWLEMQWRREEEIESKMASWLVISEAEYEGENLIISKEGIFAPGAPEEAIVLTDHPDYRQETIDRLLDLEEGDTVEMAIGIDRRSLKNTNLERHHRVIRFGR